MATRHVRALRGVVVATLATFVALLSHVTAGGAMPGPLGIGAPLVLAIFASVLLSGRTHSLRRLVPSVAASQALFHTLFVLGTPTVSAGLGGGHAQHSDADVAAALAATSTTTTAHAMHGDATMWLHHAFAGAVTIALVARGERALARLASFAFFVLRRLVATMPVPIRPAPPVALSTTWAAPCAWSLARRQAPSLLRGPPAVVAS